VKRGGIINARLAGELARLGHTDLVVVCDAGLPVPPGPAVADLAFRLGVPSFETVLSGLLEELVVEGATVAEETRESPEVARVLHDLLPDLGPRARSLGAAARALSTPSPLSPSRKAASCSLTTRGFSLSSISRGTSRGGARLTSARVPFSAATSTARDTLCTGISI